MAFNCSVSSAWDTLSLDLCVTDSYLFSNLMASGRLSETINIVAVLVCLATVTKCQRLGDLYITEMYRSQEAGSLRLGFQHMNFRGHKHSDQS